jgi:hypothetical protein
MRSEGASAFFWAYASWDNAGAKVSGYPHRRSCGFGRGALAERRRGVGALRWSRLLSRRPRGHCA